MIYRIDTVVVSARTDWKHRRNPVPPQQQVERQFPGIAERFQIVGPAMPTDLVVIGYLEAAEDAVADSIAALDEQIGAYNAMQGDGLLHTVSIDDTDYTDMYLGQFGTTSGILPAARHGDGDTRRVKQLVQFLWRAIR